MRSLSLSKLLLTIMVVSLFATSNQVLAKPLSDKAKVDQVSEQFMTQILAGEIEQAYSQLSAYLGVSPEQFNERSKKIVQDMAKLEQSVGKPLAFAKLKQQSVDEHFYKITYLLKFQTAALIWELNYYQPEQGWKLVDVSFNTDINALFK